MYYLKCQSCGFYNPVKTEYLCFCAKCNKKLGKNFQDWQKANNSGNFNDYLRKECLLEMDIQLLSRPSKKKKSWLPILIIIGVPLFLLISVIFFITISNYLGKDFVLQYLAGKTSHEVMEKPWVTNMYSNFGFSVESPVMLKKKELDLPEDILSVISEMETYSYEPREGVTIVANMIHYDPSIQTDLRGGADGALAQIKMLKGVEGLLYSEEEVNIGNIPGILQTGKFKMYFKQVEFKNAIYVYKSNSWMVSVVYEESDEIGKIAAGKVVNSIKIEI